jgi:hypothetical protein
LAKSLISSNETAHKDASSLEINDLLKSFEEHSSYSDQVNKKPVIQDKILSEIQDMWKGSFDDY